MSAAHGKVVASSTPAATAAVGGAKRDGPAADKAVADAGGKAGKTKSISKNKKRVPLRRPRGRRGGIKNRKPEQKKQPQPQPQPQQLVSTGTAAGSGERGEASTDHAVAIARFHTLQKQLAQTSDPDERARIEAEQTRLGGLQAYQDASVFGGDKLRGGETGKWCAEQLQARHGKTQQVRLLDVGSLQGTAYDKYPWIAETCIDLHPRSDKVQQYDFLDYPVPAHDEDRFDVVALSLVVNFVGDIAARGRMLRHALAYLKKDGARLLYLVLPRACVDNSRYCTHDHLRALLASCGWDDIVCQDDSARLTRWLVHASSPKPRWDGEAWPKQELRVGAQLNNFCIVVKK